MLLLSSTYFPFHSPHPPLPPHLCFALLILVTHKKIYIYSHSFAGLLLLLLPSPTTFIPFPQELSFLQKKNIKNIYSVNLDVVAFINIYFPTTAAWLLLLLLVVCLYDAYLPRDEESLFKFSIYSKYLLILK